MRAAQRGPCIKQRKHVLKLVAEAKGAPRLVRSAAGPNPATEGLIQEPTIDDQIEGIVGCPDNHRVKKIIPGLDRAIERRSRVCSGTVSAYEIVCCFAVASLAEDE